MSVRAHFNYHSWESVDLPHDWAIKGPSQKGWDASVGGGMGRLPSPGVAWYRKKLVVPLCVGTGVLLWEKSNWLKTTYELNL